ncbi:MAG: peroxiredoxin [Nitrososphaeraceae archaeon]|nr:peroxiredoxin [Nitrososphaeraceae archaeon]
MANLKEGDVAPDFELPDIDMNMRKLDEFKGRNTLLAFFPAAESPVCTTEMCVFRDSLNEFENSNTAVVGISVDGPFANKIFKINRHLNFPLLSDYKRETISNYGIVMRDLGPLKDYNAAKRSIFLLDKNGVIKYVWISDNPLVEPKYDEIRDKLTDINN